MLSIKLKSVHSGDYLLTICLLQYYLCTMYRNAKILREIKLYRIRKLIFIILEYLSPTLKFQTFIRRISHVAIYLNGKLYIKIML